MKAYNIKEGYHCNPVGCYAGSIHNSVRWQVPVYQFAARVIQRFGLRNCMDIGCGFGTKIATFLRPMCEDITGIDLEPAILHCKRTHDFGTWLVDNIEAPGLTLNKKFDLIMAADVIEHLLNPDKLFDYIKKYSTPDTLVILSTPERDVVRGKNSFGPPDNPYHVREWNQKELVTYVSNSGFTLQESFVDKYGGDTKKDTKECQILLLKWR